MPYENTTSLKILQSLIDVLAPLLFALAFLALYAWKGKEVNWQSFFKELFTVELLVLLGLAISRLFNLFLSPEVLAKIPQSYLFFALAGIAIPTMRYGIYPVFFTLWKKGLRLGLLVSFLSADEMAEPPSLVLELKYFGKHFVFVHFLLALIVAVFGGAFFDALSASIAFKGFYKAGESDIELLLIIPFALGIARLLSALVKFKISENLFSWLGFALAGSISPGPLVGYLPILKRLRKKIGYSNLFAFMIAQTLCGPVRLSLELYMFGPVFFFFRFLLAVFGGTLAGFLVSFFRLI